jgi:hypothetical protein
MAIHRSARQTFLAIALAMAAPAGVAQPQQVLFPGMEGQELLDAIRSEFAPDSTLGYDIARDSMLARTQRASGEVACVYTGFTIQLAPGVDPSTNAFAQGINTEHTWPQSMGTSVEPSRSDMHHLFPVREAVNSARGNYPLAEIPDPAVDSWYRLDVTQTSAPAVALDEWSERDNSHPVAPFTARFEPREDHAGDAARAAYYIRAIYPDRVAAAGADDFFEVQREDLLSWTYADPVDADEYARAQWIASHQGSMNPFVLDSTLGRRAYGERIDAGGGPPPAYAATVWVNEIHYDNEGTDVGEFVELVIPADVDPTDVVVTLYNGNGGAAYDTRSAVTGTAGTTAPGFAFYTLDYGGTTPLQNGSPDGIAVTIEGEVVLFASYEGVFTAVDGPAAGLESVDIGVGETASTPAGQSIALRGSGSAYRDFEWFPPAPASPGDVNPGQTFVPVAAEPDPAAASQLIVIGPNPFRSQTRLELDLAAAGPVIVDVFDALGRRVARLLDATLPTGSHALAMSAADLSPGIYAVRFLSRTDSIVRLVTLSR